MLVAFGFLILDLLIPIKESIVVRNLEPVLEKFKDYGFWAPFFISLSQALLVLLTVFPGSPIQIIAGFTLGPVVGFLSVIIGVFTGNLIIYILVRKLGSHLLLNEKDIDKVGEISAGKEGKTLSKTIMVLYFFPIIPYGLVAFTVANSKIKFLKYMLITTLGTIPSIIICIGFGSLIITASYTVTAITFLVLVLLTIITARYYKQIIKYFTKIKPKQDMEFFQNNVIKPRPITYTFWLFILYLLFIPRLKVKSNAKDFRKKKKPYVLIYNHPSKLDWAYTFIPLFPNKLNAIMAYYYFCNYKLGRLLHKLGCFPKFLFQPDISSIKNIKKVIKADGILGIAPEGRLSAYGELESITPATSKLLKHLNVPIVLGKINGAYLTFPKWAKNIRVGRVEVIFEELFSTEDLNRLSIEEIDQKLLEKLHYDDFTWQEKNHIYYKGKKFSEGLEHVLYLCPVCGGEFTTQTKDNHIYCTNCDMDVVLNNYYEFETKSIGIPKNIKEWYLYQKEIESKNIQDPLYKLESNVILKLPDPEGKGFKEVGSGITTLTHQGVKYVGTINNEEKEIIFKIQNLPAIPFGVKEDFEIYHHNTLYYFIPENMRECVKWSVVGELIYNKYVKENN